MWKKVTTYSSKQNAVLPYRVRHPYMYMYLYLPTTCTCTCASLLVTDWIVRERQISQASDNRKMVYMYGNNEMMPTMWNVRVMTVKLVSHYWLVSLRTGIVFYMINFNNKMPWIKHSYPWFTAGRCSTEEVVTTRRNQTVFNHHMLTI